MGKELELKLELACLGKSRSQGGMNVPELNQLAISKGYTGPKLRQNLLDFLCRAVKPAVKPVKPVKPELSEDIKNAIYISWIQEKGWLEKHCRINLQRQQTDVLVNLLPLCYKKCLNLARLRSVKADIRCNSFFLI